MTRNGARDPRTKASLQPWYDFLRMEHKLRTAYLRMRRQHGVTADRIVLVLRERGKPATEQVVT